MQSEITGGPNDINGDRKRLDISPLLRFSSLFFNDGSESMNYYNLFRVDDNIPTV